jgi:hypothetical protein
MVWKIVRITACERGERAVSENEGEFDRLLAAATWRPIRGCPGRLVLAGPPPAPLASLCADPARAREHLSAAARDPVVVVELDRGCGVIAYRRPDGALLCTLNTAEGFARKLAALGLPPPRAGRPA